MLLKFDGAHPVEGRDLIPVAPFVSHDYHEEERNKVFSKCWLNVGSINDIPNPGDYFTRDLKVLNLQLLVVRDRDGVVRAFHNVCTHRGNQIARDPTGNARTFTCNFHSWVFSTQGDLIHVPKELTFCGLDATTRGLRPIALDTWLGWVFINIDPAPEQTLREYLGDLWDFTEGHPLATWQRCGRYGAHVQANWKTFQVSFMESSHVKTVHKRTVEDYAAEVVSPSFYSLGKHGNMSFRMNSHHNPYPAELAAFKASPGFLTRSGNQTVAGVNRDKRADWAFDEFVVFPNFLFMIGDGWVTSHVFWPLGADETDWEGCYYAEGGNTPSKSIANSYFAYKLRDTVREDLVTVETMHRGLRSGAMKTMVLCEEEALIGHHASVVQSYVDAGAA